MIFMERRQQIKFLMLERKSVSVSELTEQFGVSAETIRRDLSSLEHEGFLSKAYGGAVINQRAQPLVPSNTLVGILVAEKKRIAKKAASLLHNNDAIFIDHSTTAFYICEEISEMSLTVVTNSLSVMLHLSKHPNISLVAIGGAYNCDNDAFFGVNAIKSLRNYHLDKSFISSRALDRQNGLSDNNEIEAEMHRTVLEIAGRNILLADHTKLNKASFIRTCDFSHINTVITDEKLSLDWRDFFTNKRIEWLECAE